MKYLDTLKFNSEYLCFEEGFEIDNWAEITLLVGDQGCGKSTLLDRMSTNAREIDVKLLPGVKDCKTYYFDSEKMNPRVVDPKMYTLPNGEETGIGFIGATMTRFQSHGEVLLQYTVNMLEKGKDSVLLVDEPESGLSLRSQYKLIKAIKKAAKNGCQLVIATHCLPLIKSQEKVYSMEHKKWMYTKDFILTQQK